MWLLTNIEKENMSMFQEKIKFKVDKLIASKANVT